MYVTANAALLAGIGALVTSVDKIQVQNLAWGSVIITMVGVLLNVNWFRTIVSYGVLSRAKSKVVAAIEDFLPARLFDAEWMVLEANQYRSTTDTDKQTAWFFILLFAAFLLISFGASLALAWAQWGKA